MYKKYPRTQHCPWSLSSTSDDCWNTPKDMTFYEGKRVVATAKLDGQCTTWYSDHSHARSIDSMHSNDPSRSYNKMLHGGKKYLIPEGWRFVGEDVYACHSILYDNLPAYFFIFAIFDEEGYCLAWDELVEWCRMINVPHVPILYDGIYHEEIIRNLWPRPALFSSDENDEEEGYVVRIADSFHESEFKRNVFKMVRENHVKPNSQHWFKNWRPNELDTKYRDM